MIPQDITTGMIVETQDRQLNIAIGGQLISYTGVSKCISEYNDLLEHSQNPDFNISTVYSEPNLTDKEHSSFLHWLTYKAFIKYSKILWKRTDTVELTLDQISLELGINVKLKETK